MRAEVKTRATCRVGSARYAYAYRGRAQGLPDPVILPRILLREAPRARDFTAERDRGVGPRPDALVSSRETQDEAYSVQSLSAVSERNGFVGLPEDRLLQVAEGPK